MLSLASDFSTRGAIVPELAVARQEGLIITRGASGGAVRAIQRRCSAGQLARLAPGVYVREHDASAQAARVRQHWVRILGELAPGSVVSYRSAYAELGAADPVVILSHPTRFNRTVHLPGLRVALVKGPAALPGDTPLGEGRLHRASTERMLLENLTRPRGSEGRSRGEAAVAERLSLLLAAGTAGALAELRERARELAKPLNMAKEFSHLERLIAALPGSGPGHESGARPGRAGSREAPADASCIGLLQALAARLGAQRLPHRQASATEEPARTHHAFVEAYFACCARSDALSLEQARQALLLGRFPEPRGPALAQLLGVFRLALHSPLCDSVPPFGAWFPQALKARHALMGLTGAEPEQLRLGAGGASAVGGVDPERIRSTLIAGSKLARGVPDGLARAILYSVLVLRTQPFEHGNEPLAYLLMNAELSSVGEARIIIPARSRSRIDQSREALMLGGDAGPYIAALDQLQGWTSALDFSELDRLLVQVGSGAD